MPNTYILDRRCSLNAPRIKRQLEKTKKRSLATVCICSKIKKYLCCPISRGKVCNNVNQRYYHYNKSFLKCQDYVVCAEKKGMKTL